VARSLPPFLARPLIQLWLAHSPRSWQRRQVIAADSPHVHAPGMNPDRVLLTGDGVATGRGVLTHDLGLPGHLARSLSARTGHATDVDIVVDDDMTVRTCLQALADTDLFRYDVVLLSLGHNEALGLMSLKTWRDDLGALLEVLTERVPAATRIFLLPIPVFGPRTGLPAYLARVLDGRAKRLDAVTAELVSGAPQVTLIGDGGAYEFQAEDAHVYRVWADGVAAQISAELDPDRLLAGSTAEVDEEGRAAAVECSGLADVVTDPVLDGLTRAARQVFGTSTAVITLIHSDIQTMISRAGGERIVIPRHESFCDVTIRRAGHLVIEDATLDPRYDQFPTVAGDASIRFYAGYPIESPDGHRIGAFCVMDTEPRSFAPSEVALLRKLAQSAQDHLWQLPNA
jgi:hypothetical protein